MPLPHRRHEWWKRSTWPLPSGNTGINLLGVDAAHPIRDGAIQGAVDGTVRRPRRPVRCLRALPGEAVRVTELDIERTYEPDDGRIRRLLDLVTGRKPAQTAECYNSASTLGGSHQDASEAENDRAAGPGCRSGCRASLKAALEENHKVPTARARHHRVELQRRGRALTDSGPRAREERPA